MKQLTNLTRLILTACLLLTSILTLSQPRKIVNKNTPQTSRNKTKQNGLNNKNDLPASKEKATQNITDSTKVVYISGTIYFSGDGFPNAIRVDAKDSIRVNDFVSRCKPGSIITFDNCIYRTSDGKLSKPVNKSIKL
jgi:hypothetical protein